MRVAGARIWRTDDDKFVGDDHPDARFLVAAEGDDIPEDAKDVPSNLVAGKHAAPVEKQAPAAKNKAVKGPDADK